MHGRRRQKPYSFQIFCACVVALRTVQQFRDPGTCRNVESWRQRNAAAGLLNCCIFRGLSLSTLPGRTTLIRIGSLNEPARDILWVMSVASAEFPRWVSRILNAKHGVSPSITVTAPCFEPGKVNVIDTGCTEAMTAASSAAKSGVFHTPTHPSRKHNNSQYFA